jgi:flagellar protein FliJ
MKKSQRIKTLVEIKSEQEKNALKDLGAAQKKSLDIQTQVESLKKYRQEYQNKFNRLGGSGIKIAQLIEFKSFINKLDQAIAGQERSLRLSQENLLAKRKIWESFHHKANCLQKIHDSAMAAEIKHEIKREQLELDERATRLGRNNQNSIETA